MWFVGAVLGAIVGAGIGNFSGFVVGGVIGGFVGWAFGAGRRNEIAELKERVGRLEEGLAALSRSVVVAPAPSAQPEEEFERAVAASAAAAPAAEPAPEPVLAQEPAEPAATIVPAEPPAPAAPGFWERLIGGNLVAKVGIVILFFGVAFLLKYAYERVHVPIELRLLGVSVGAIAMLALGWRFRLAKPAYALALQGGGVGVLYLVIFGAFRLFGLLPAPLAFAMLVGIAAASAVLAVAQNSLTLAVTGVAGGFLAPVLASSGQGSHVMLFSYYAVLNGGIVMVAWMKAWRVLNIVGFAFTFIIAWTWGEFSYRPEHYGSTQPFLVLFFLMYVAIPILFARRRAVELKDYVDGTLVFGVPLVAAGLQSALVRPWEFGMAWSALALGAFYIGLAATLIRRAGADLRLLAESYIALGVAFATLAIPLAFDGRLTSAAWALEGAAVAWIGLRQDRRLARAFGYLLQFAAGIAFLGDISDKVGATPLLNSFWLGCFFIAAGAFFCASGIDRSRDRLGPVERIVGLVLLGWGALWWYGGGIHEIARHVDLPYRMHSILLLFATSSVAFSVIARLRNWTGMQWLWPLMYLAIVVQLGYEIGRGLHPFDRLGYAGWGATFLAHFWLLAKHAQSQPVLVTRLHAAGLWIIAVVGARELGWWMDRAVEGARVWSAIAWALVPALLLLAVSSTRVRARWPVSSYERSYVRDGAAPLAVFLALWILAINFTNSGNPHPLPYVPVVNPLDLAIAAAFLLVARWLIVLRGIGFEDWWRTARGGIHGIYGALGFVWVNGMLLRTLHHWAGLPFALEPMLRSRLVQASFSILWTLLALSAMLAATRRGLRALWVAGAVLMAVVVGKLFLVDLSGTGTVERIVSFIGVGVLMLVVGYFSPVPPKSKGDGT